MASRKPRTTRRARPTQAEVLQGWKDGYAPDLAGWRASFAFLAEEHGFTVSESVVPAACTLDYTRGDARISIQREYSDAPWITVRRGERGFGLAQMPGAPQGASVEEQARFVRANLAAVLAYAPPP